MAVDIDDVMNLWSKDKLQPTLIAEDIVEAAKEIVPRLAGHPNNSKPPHKRPFQPTQSASPPPPPC